jgi:hypothetical protein
MVVGEEPELLQGLYAQQVGLIHHQERRDLFTLYQALYLLVYLDIEFGPGAGAAR